tara:strand:- start:2363 stop:2551 length:189 start_codon:yes stop_codon:yes gene_type:complete
MPQKYHTDQLVIATSADGKRQAAKILWPTSLGDQSSKPEAYMVEIVATSERGIYDIAHLAKG